jgi:hypothetical protein
MNGHKQSLPTIGVASVRDIYDEVLTEICELLNVSNQGRIQAVVWHALMSKAATGELSRQNLKLFALERAHEALAQPT